MLETGLKTDLVGLPARSVRGDGATIRHLRPEGSLLGTDLTSGVRGLDGALPGTSTEEVQVRLNAGTGRRRLLGKGDDLRVVI